MKMILQMSHNATRSMALSTKGMAYSFADFFKNRPNSSLPLILCLGVLIFSYNKHNQSIELDVTKTYFAIPYKSDAPTLDEQITELETYYLEEILVTDTASKEVVTNKNSYLSGSYYHFDQVNNYFLRRGKRALKKFKKDEMQKILLTSIPTALRENAHYYVSAILAIAQKYSVDPLWVTSIMWTESHFKFKARSGVGASGLMQIMPRTKKYLIQKIRNRGIRLESIKGWDHLAGFNPDIKTWKDYKTFKSIVLNIELGTFYLKSLLNTFGSHKLATVAYNMGPGWTRGRLRRKLPIGVKNLYLTKVRRAYSYMSKRFPKS